MKHNLFNFTCKFLKYYGIVADIMMLIYCVFYLFNIKIWLMYYLFGFSAFGFVALTLVSFLLGFCWLYRSFLIHNYVIYSCIVFKQECLLSIFTDDVCLILVVFGILLLSLLTNKCL